MSVVMLRTIQIGGANNLAAACILMASFQASISPALAEETILQRCARETGASPGIKNAPGAAELLKCIDSAQSKQASQVGDRACNVNVCIFRLRYVSEGTYSGGGYTLKHRVSSRASKVWNENLTTYESILTTDDGKRTVFGQSVGPVGSIFTGYSASSISGEIRGASYTGPFGTGADAYVALAVPREFVATDQEQKAAVLPQDCQTASTTDLLPCGLRGKIVAYRYEESSIITFQDGKVSKSGTRQNGKILFGNNDDVYVFLPIAGDRVRQNGFAYKLNLEIDFMANRSRAPKDFTAEIWPVEPTVYKGRMELKSDTLVINDVFAFNTGTSRQELKIRFSRDFDTCSVADFSSVFDASKGADTFEKHSTSRLAKQIDCRMYSAK